MELEPSQPQALRQERGRGWRPLSASMLLRHSEWHVSRARGTRDNVSTTEYPESSMGPWPRPSVLGSEKLAAIKWRGAIHVLHVVGNVGVPPRHARARGESTGRRGGQRSGTVPGERE